MEYTLRISLLIATQFTVEKSDFEWFAATNRNCFCTAASNCTKFNSGKTILENLCGELYATNTKQFEINLLFNTSFFVQCPSFSLVRSFVRSFSMVCRRHANSIQWQSCVNKPTFKPIYRRENIKMLLAGLGSVRIVKNCDLGLENAFSRPWSQFFH